MSYNWVLQSIKNLSALISHQLILLLLRSNQHRFVCLPNVCPPIHTVCVFKQKLHKCVLHHSNLSEITVWRVSVNIILSNTMCQAWLVIGSDPWSPVEARHFVCTLIPPNLRQVSVLVLSQTRTESSTPCTYLVGSTPDLLYLHLSILFLTDKMFCFV